MSAEQMFSDEPTRVGALVSEFLSNQSGSVVSPPEGPLTTLVVGADSRDDCAVFDVAEPASVVVGSDYVRGPKFVLHELGLLSNFDIGYYAVAANVSDVAAMGATPIGVLTVVRYPPEMDDSSFREVMAGIHEACTDFGTLNVGGDIGGAERLILSGSAVGIAHRGKTIGRAGARPGDLLCVTGPCGDLGAAVAYFPRRDTLGHLDTDVERRLIDAWRRPRARVAEGRILGVRGFATACQDTSDGLKATIEQIARASEVGFMVDESSIPVSDLVTKVAGAIGLEPIALSLSASSDFQLVFTLPAPYLAECASAFADDGLSFDVIGTATTDLALRMVRSDGTTSALPGVAWKHQDSDISTLAANGPDVASRS